MRAVMSKATPLGVTPETENTKFQKYQQKIQSIELVVHIRIRLTL